MLFALLYPLSRHKNSVLDVPLSQEKVSAAGYAAYRFRRVAELTTPQLAESVGLLGLRDTRYAARAKVRWDIKNVKQIPVFVVRSLFFLVVLSELEILVREPLRLNSHFPALEPLPSHSRTRASPW